MTRRGGRDRRTMSSTHQASELRSDSRDRGAASTLLSVSDLHVRLRTGDGSVDAVGGVSLDVLEGERVGVVGESGAGKSILGRSILGLFPDTTISHTGEIWFDGTNLLDLPEKQLRRYRGGRLAMVFQDPMTFLNPTRRIGSQITEAARTHRRREQVAPAVDRALRDVGLPPETGVARRYPHELSGGMRQRALIAMALAADPDLLIADEVTTALDVTIQAQVLQTLYTLTEQRNMALIVITHDLGIVAEVCDRVYVMQGGHIVEDADVHTLFARPRHSYTQMLLDSAARDALATTTATNPVLFHDAVKPEALNGRLP